MIVKWRWNLDKGGLCLCFSAHPSKAFDCTVNNFLMAKLEVYGLTYETLDVMKN